MRPRPTQPAQSRLTCGTTDVSVSTPPAASCLLLQQRPPAAPPQIGPVQSSERVSLIVGPAQSRTRQKDTPPRANSKNAMRRRRCSDAASSPLVVCAVFSKLQSFLPQLAAANIELEQRIASGEATAVDIEVVEGALAARMPAHAAPLAALVVTAAPSRRRLAVSLPARRRRDGTPR